MRAYCGALALVCLCSAVARPPARCTHRARWCLRCAARCSACGQKKNQLVRAKNRELVRAKHRELVRAKHRDSAGEAPRTGVAENRHQRADERLLHTQKIYGFTGRAKRAAL